MQTLPSDKSLGYYQASLSGRSAQFPSSTKSATKFPEEPNQFTRDSIPSDPEQTESSSPLVTGIALAGGNHVLTQRDGQNNDEILWSKEMASLDLRKVDLITLSACQTAIGELVPGEGMLGSQRALHVAGARSTLTAIWSVQDKATRILMAKFYENLWGRRLSKAAALQKAMVWMLREYEWETASDIPNSSRRRTPPALWDGFVLHGDWQ